MELLKLSNLLHLYRARLRARLVQELLALTGIAVGVSLLFAASVANTSLLGSVTQLQAGIVGNASLQLVARSPHGFDEALLREVQALPSVRAAAPVLEVYATLRGPQGRRPVTLVGADPRFARLGGELLRRFKAGGLERQRAIGLPMPIARAIGVTFGDSVVIDASGRRAAALLGTQLHEDDIGPLIHSPVALAPLAYAQEITDTEGRLTRIFVEPRPGMDELARADLTRVAADRVNVRSGDFDVELFREAAAPTSQSTALFAAFSALVGFLFAFSAMLLTVPQRRRLIVDLRLSGHDAPVVIQVLLFDALVLGALASVLGIGLGDLLSRRLFDGVPGYLAAAFPIGEQRLVTWQSFAVAAGGGLLAAAVAVLAPVREIFSRRPPLGDVVRPARPGASRWLMGAGAVLLAITAAILAFAPAAALVGMIALTGALLVLLSPLLDGVVRLVAPLGRRIRSIVPFLAVAELRARSTRPRALAVMATGAVAVFGSVAILGAHGDLQRGLDHSAHDVNAIADVWASSAGYPNLFATMPFESRVEEQLAALDGVREVRRHHSGFLDVDDRRVWVLAPPNAASEPIPRSQLLDGDYHEAVERLRAGGWAVVDDALAKEHELEIGDSFSLPAPRPARFKVAAISTNIGWPSGAVILNADDFTRAWDSAAPAAYHLIVAAGSSARVVRERAARVLRSQSAFAVETREGRTARHRAASRQGLARLTQIALLVLIAAVIAMSAAMGGLIWQRRARLAQLKVDGVEERELWRALMLESVVLLGVGCAVGAAFGLCGQLLLARALSTVTGFPVDYALAAPVALGSVLVVTVVAVAIVTVPGYAAARVRPALGLQD